MDDRKLGHVLRESLREELRQVLREELEPIRQELVEIRSQLDGMHSNVGDVSDDTPSETPMAKPQTSEISPAVFNEDVEAINDSANADLDSTWSKALMLIQAQTKEQQFDVWFGDTNVDRYDEITETAFVTTKNEFARMWLQSHYMDLVQNALGAVTDRKWIVQFVLDSK